MSLHVQGQVITSGKRPGTQMTLEGFGARVLAIMSRQFVGSGKLPTAAFP